MKSGRKISAFTITCIGLPLLLGIFIIDILTPRGIADGLLYIGFLILSVRTNEKRFIIMSCIASVALIIAGYFLSPTIPLSLPYIAIDNRLLSIAVVIVCSITMVQRVQADKGLKASEEKFRNFFENTMVPMYSSDMQKTKTIEVNKAGAELFGYDSGKEFLEKFNPLAHYTNIHERESLINEIKEKGELSGKIIELKKLNGTHFWAKMYIVLNEAKNISQTVIIDISELTDARETLSSKVTELEALFQYASMGILVVNSEGEIVNANPLVEKLFQYQKAELIGKKVEILIPNRFAKKHEAHREKYRLNPQPRLMGTGLDLFGMRKDGTEFPVEIALSPYTTTKGNFVTAVIMDITSRKRDEAIITEKTIALQESYNTLEKKNISLEKMNKELEAFTFISSHDLQEPLRKIKTFASVIIEEEQKNLSKTGKDYLEKMQVTVLRMRDLLEDLLAYSRVKNRDHKFEKSNLIKIVEEVIADFKNSIEEKKAVIKTEGFCEPTIIPFQFRQLVQNLISNALKFSHPERTPYIIIKSEIETTGSKANKDGLLPEIQYCHLSVSDNGIGFDPIYKDRIFGIFQRLHEYDEYKGSGIGLAICKRIVENHNGIITASGKLNEGARFDVYFPTEQKN